jgi:Flp pilus assembly pilin Flp
MSRKNRVSLPLIMSRGQTMAEYALILATIAAISIALVQSAGTIISELVGQVRPLL